MEVKALYSRYRRLAPRGYLRPSEFRETLGILGLSEDPFLPDRMFSVFDANRDGQLCFFEFATSLAVMLRGTEEEKLKLSFEMMAGRRGATGISLADFEGLVHACHAMALPLIEPAWGPASKEDVRRLFHDLASGRACGEAAQSASCHDGMLITFEQYLSAVHGSDDFLRCLGLESLASRSRNAGLVRQTSLALVQERNSTLSFASNDAGGEAVAERLLSKGNGNDEGASSGLLLVSTSRLDELRSHVEGLRKALEAKEPAARIPTFANMESDIVGNVHRQRDHWFGFRRRIFRWPLFEIPSTMCWCAPCSASVVDEFDARPRAPQAQETASVELDGILEWCKRCDEATIADRPCGNGYKLDCRGSGDGEFPWGNGVGGSGEACGGSGDDEIQKWPASRRGTSTPPRSVTGGPASATCSSSARRKTSLRLRNRLRLLGPKNGIAVHFGHEDWNMVLSMMVGIRMALGRIKGEACREVTPADFSMREKFSIVPRVANILDSAASDRAGITRFIDYAPLVFEKIRSSFGIQHNDYSRSVGPERLLGNMILGNLSTLAELSSEGKSGAFFYSTADGKYMMKTVSPKEFHLLWRLLKAYYEYVMQNPNTLLVRFLGLHNLSIRGRQSGVSSAQCATQEVYFVVMANCFNAPLQVHKRYDLKGSWVGRVAPRGQLNEPAAVFKDMDFEREGERIRVGDRLSRQLMEQIDKDVMFLRDHGIIDYSLLVGVHELGRDMVAGTVNGLTCVDSIAEIGRDHSLEESLIDAQRQGGGALTNQLNSGGLLSSDGKFVYFLGIIDILTTYDSSKKLEHHVKSVLYGRRGISCCPPHEYADRFLTFLRRAFV
eukprot:TRINITY_DN36677_c0_g1_i1.p1 TRINITY_DN36677_c0_g1~~TRINITY_DN36677_c0_g1_i1.p1  ORF type:complete len:898 (-),score=133.29 TRINITY_DN36677_c0_g1_i1:105-2621(-)